MPMVNITARGMSVEAARAKPMMLARDAMMRDVSSSEPGRQRRMNPHVTNTMTDVRKAVGTRAAQSWTPKML
jgi:hypothetical protein